MEVPHTNFAKSRPTSKALFIAEDDGSDALSFDDDEEF